MRAARIDGNQNQIVNDLRHLGASVQSLAKVGSGAPDIAVGWKGRNFLFEIKEPGKKLNKAQVAWHQCWRGTVWVIEGTRDALEVLADPTTGTILDSEECIDRVVRWRR